MLSDRSVERITHHKGSVFALESWAAYLLWWGNGKVGWKGNGKRSQRWFARGAWKVESFAWILEGKKVFFERFFFREENPEYCGCGGVNLFYLGFYNFSENYLKKNIFPNQKNIKQYVLQADCYLAVYYLGNSLN